jgi:hypothetical protein
MKIKFLTAFALLMLNSAAFSKDAAVAVATNKVGENLNLELVSAEFGVAKDLEDFERRLNDPKSKVSNLDLNNDGQVDYLIVSERKGASLHYVDIDASIGKDKKQTVATIEVENNASNNSVRIVGETSIYGSEYMYAPVYVQPPVFFTLFWAAAYQPWYSPWRWGYYPPIYRPWGVRPIGNYNNDVNLNINRHNNVIVRKDNNVLNVDRNNSARQNNVERANSVNRSGERAKIEARNSTERTAEVRQKVESRQGFGNSQRFESGQRFENSQRFGNGQRVNSNMHNRAPAMRSAPGRRR